MVQVLRRLSRAVRGLRVVPVEASKQATLSFSCHSFDSLVELTQHTRTTKGVVSCHPISIQRMPVLSCLPRWVLVGCSLSGFFTTRRDLVLKE